VRLPFLLGGCCAVSDGGAHPSRWNRRGLKSHAVATRHDALLQGDARQPTMLLLCCFATVA
jgi:hypothetical protein